MIKKNKTILVVAAHPDDDVLGCGGTLKKLSKKGSDINLIFLSDGVSSRKMTNKKFLQEISRRKKACERACRILGSNKPIFYDLPDNSLDTVSFLKIVKLIKNHIDKIKPEIIFTHFHNDLNIDHSITNRAVVTACRPLKNNPVKILLFFEVPSSTEWQITGKKENLFNPNWFEDISLELNSKIKALKAYKSEIRKWPHPRSEKGVKALAQWRGATAGFKAAEAFILGRKI
ncbi:PIG-L family deacetylase [Pelagibacteraceae bacterium]|nr:PIG-L family deacetylase [Pelagibacteraceae bacterium]